VYLDSTAYLDDRVEDLLGRMTLDEKIGQMTQAERGALTSASDIRTYRLGSLLSGGGSGPEPNTPEAWADMYDNFQLWALTTPLAVPLIYGIDAVHGHNNVKGAVIFPHNIGLGCTWNPDLVRQAEHITAAEVAGTGIDWTFAPCIAMPRDERWGRTYEGFAETPELTVLMSEAAVKGLQGDTLAHPLSVLACAKHYLGDGGTTGGDDQGNTQLDTTQLRAIHLPGYQAAIEAGVGSVMASYSSWNGQKLHGSYYLLTTLLKGELGFKGFVVSDWAGIDQLPGDYTSDVETSVNAGIDMVMVPNEYKLFISTLKTLVEQGKVQQSRIDDAVRRILRIKFEMGLFERPYTDLSLTSEIGSDAHREVARECVRQSLVLLKKKDNILPLPKTGLQILVAGKNADDLGNQCGGWSISWQGSGGEITTGTTILEGIQSAAPGNTVTYSREGQGAAGADLGIVVIGETPYAEGAGDRTDLELSDEDILTVRTVKNAGIPVIVVLISGRPMIIESIWHYSDVFIAVWLPGTEGQGVADVLFGDAPPSGRLSHSWPKSMEQIPVNAGDAVYHPKFEYGYGITTFENPAAGSAPEVLSAATTADGQAIEITFNKEMSAPAAAQTGFSVQVSGGNAPGVQQAGLKVNDSTTIVLTLTAALQADDEITLSYTAGTVQAADGGMLASFTDADVYNLYGENQAGFAVPGRIEAEDYNAMNGVQTENTSDTGGGINVGWIDTNDWLSYMIHVSESGLYQIAYRVAAQSVSGQIQAGSSLSTTLLAQTNLPITGGWQTWATVTTNIELQQGVQSLKLTASRGGFNLNWFELTLISNLENESRYPETCELRQNYPNPFNPGTTIEFSLPRQAFVRLAIFDVRGQLQRTLLSEVRSAGSHQLFADLSDLPSGVYFYRLQTSEGISLTRRMLLLR